MATKKKLTKRKVLKGGNPVRESPWMYRVPDSHKHLKDMVKQAMTKFDSSRSEVITTALDYYFTKIN
jgi:hypothetical protein